ncbi:MAG: GNAT family protein [Myxococcota bacterium]
MAARLRTTSLQLVPATAQHVLIALEGAGKLARLLAAEPAEAWPPSGLDEAALRAELDRLHREPGARDWGLWFVLHRGAGKPTLTGGIRFERAPTDGVTSLTYALLDPAVAGEAVVALLDWAFEDHDDLQAVRCTVHADGPSAGVLVDLGFEEVDGDALVYAKHRASWLEDGPPSRRAPPLVPPPADIAVAGLPSVAADVFNDLLSEPLRTTEQTRGAVQAYLQFIEAEAAASPSVDLAIARDVARVCEGLLDAVTDKTPEHARRQIQAAARYFVTEADGDSDLDIGGLDEDAAVANAVAEHLGRADLVTHEV